MSHSPAGYWTILGLGALVASVSDFRSVLLVAAAVLLLGMGCLAAGPLAEPAGAVRAGLSGE